MEAVRDKALPQMSGRRHIRIWDAGCAMGAEPYSLAIILRENMGNFMFRNVKIIATDIDCSQRFEEIIREGRYPDEQVRRIPPNILEKHFRQADGGAFFRVSAELRKCVEYRRHDLLSMVPVGGDFSLVMCKNVLLHFKPAERVAVMQMFYDALEPGGFFVTEQTQKLPLELNGMFEPVVRNSQLFRKIDCPARLRCGSA